MIESTQLLDCGCQQRTKEHARACQCDGCKRWWADNVPGYFYCPRCRDVCTPLADRYDGVCEQCFDNRDVEEK
jgi:hypothetical protein